MRKRFCVFISGSTIGLFLFCCLAIAEETSSPRIEEIIVVAQKRAESVQKVPVAVSVVSADMIHESGLLTIPDLTIVNPSVSFDTSQSFQRSSLKIRGIGTIGNSRTFEGAVGVFIDGVYRSRSGMVLTDLLDIDHLEILRGPQSALFGKNTVAGAIAATSARPDSADSFAQLRIGNFGLNYLSGALNARVNDDLVFRFAGDWHQRDAFFTSPDNGDGFDNVDRYGLKAQMLWTPTDDLEVWLIVDYKDSDANCCWGSAMVEAGPTAALVDVYSSLNGLTFVAPPAGERDRSVSMNTHAGEKIRDAGFTATIEWDINDMKFRSITAFRNWEHNQIEADVDYVAADLLRLNEPAEIDSYSQEFNLIIPFGSNDRSDLLLGFYYGHEEYESLQSVETGGDADNYLNALISAGFGAVACLPGVVEIDCLFPSGIGALVPDGEFARSAYTQDSDSLAAFAHATIGLSERFDLTAGLRYSIEEKSGGADNQFWYDSFIVRAVLEAAGLPDDGTPRNGFDLIGTFYSPSFTDKTRDEETTGLISLTFHLSDDVLIYGGYHRGFKAGGVNLFREGVVTDTTTYEPETADSFEFGFKSQYWDGRAISNIAVFHTEISDLQINFFTGLEFRTENTGEATTSGVEFENTFLLTENLRFDLSATFLDAKFGELNNEFLSYLDDRDTPRAPELAAVATLFYERPVGDTTYFFVRGMASYMGEHYVGADVPTEEKVSSYTIFDASIGLRRDDGRWEAMLWCSNCVDEDYRTIFFNTTFQPGSLNSYLNPPRQYGVTLSTHF